ncbi:MAG: RNA polymerase factor sigma-54 [Opitutales bacterium]|nr:RNA polymerase factor sigma-54 [Opitutales bacterium]
MATQGFQQVQKQVQSMVLAPQLRQSLKILQVPALELRSAILEELQTNPTLEELPFEDISIEERAEKPKDEDFDSGSDGDSEDAPPTDEFERPADSHESAERMDFSDDFSVLEKLHEDYRQQMYEDAGERPYTSEDAERRQHFFDSLTSTTSLQEHLMDQATMSEEDKEVLQALEYLIGNLDESGFLTESLSDAALVTNLPLRKLQAASKLLKTLDPVGIGSENVQECLLTQLQSKGRKDALIAKIIRNHWNLLLRRRIPDIARKTGANTEDVETALREISQLDPAPARRFSEDNNQVIEPDVTVQKDDDGDWQIILNNDYVPKLRISPIYKQMLAQGRLKGKDREYVQEKFRSSRFLINAIEQRQQTIERITRQLLRFQNDFFERGTAGLHPLTMNQVAEAVEVHETTVSRAIANKYIRTPHGVFEMKYFFTPGYQSDDGQSLSNKSVKERIARIIESEPSSKPFSDQKVVKILEEEGVKIARRTVAKYREELGILPTNLRRKYS